MCTFSAAPEQKWIMQLWVYLSSAGFASASIAKSTPANGGSAAGTGSSRTNGSPAQVCGHTIMCLSAPHEY